VKIREAAERDLAAIARVAERSDLLIGDLNEGNFPSMLRWLYAEAPHDSRVQFVAEHDGAIVAHYGAVPFRYKLPGRETVAGFASNLVIDKDHRAGMLFLSLQSYLQRAYRQAGFGFVYGLITRANVLEPHLRTGWKKLGSVPVYAKPFDFPRVASSYLRNPFVRGAAHLPLKAAEALWKARWSGPVRGVAIEEVAEFAPDADAFLAAFMERLEVSALRTRSILNWRFRGCRERAYRIFVARRAGRFAGYVVTREMALKHLQALVVVDIAFDPADRAAGVALLRQCDRVAKRAHVDVAASIVNPDSPFAPYLRRAGYLKTPEAFTLVVHAPKDSPPPAVDEQLFARWHLTWFEHDYV
jgi:predicted N-acetyltransferase YhbS